MNAMHISRSSRGQAWLTAGDGAASEGAAHMPCEKQHLLECQKEHHLVVRVQLSILHTLQTHVGKIGFPCKISCSVSNQSCCCHLVAHPSQNPWGLKHPAFSFSLSTPSTRPHDIGKNCSSYPQIVFLFICMNIWSVLMSVCQLCTWFSWRPEEGIGCPGTRVTDDCELSFGSWKLNPAGSSVRATSGITV